MNLFINLFFSILPIATFIMLGYATAPRQGIFAFFFAIISLSAVFCNTSDGLKFMILSAFKKGLMLFAGFVFIIAFLPVGGLISRPLLLEHSHEKAQAIFVLASGATMAREPNYSGLQRVTHGIKLLKKGQAPHLFISTGWSKINGHAESEWVASYVALIDISPASITILVSPEIVTTSTEARYAYRVLSAQNLNDILLVTSGAHILRSNLVFKKAGFNVKPAPVHDRNNVLYANENYIGSFHAAMREWFGLLYYWLTNKI